MGCLRADREIALLSCHRQKENRYLCEVSYSRDIGAPSPSRGGGRRSPPIQSAWRSSAAPCRGCRIAPPPARRRTARLVELQKKKNNDSYFVQNGSLIPRFDLSTF